MSLLDHLWQSTLVAVVVYGLAWLLRDNRASIRHGLWFAASVKFLLPFSLITALGRMVFVHPVAASSMAVITRIQPMAAPSLALPAPAVHHTWLTILPALWLFGMAVVAAVWLAQWWRLRAAVRAAKPLASDLPVPVKATPLLLEPGLVGIRRPVILLPESLVDSLSATEIAAILNHELCHLRRRDNLLAAIHMLVEAVFWFHPLVWLIGARLEEERERACDEAVLAGGRNPLEYAHAILTVCRLYLRSPLPCAAGISGADLDRRISAIMTRDGIRDIGSAKTLLLVGALGLTVLIPLVAGGLKSVPAAAVAQLVQALAPAAQGIAIHEPASRIAIPAQAAVLHRHRKAVAVLSPPRVALLPPDFAPIPVMAATFVPRLPPAPTDRQVCRPPQQLAGSRLMGPAVCLPQTEWDRIQARGQVLMPDGRTVTARFDGALPRPPCTGTGASAAATGMGIASCF